MKSIRMIVIAVVMLSLAGGNAWSQDLNRRTTRQWDVMEVAAQPKPKKEKKAKTPSEFSRKKGIYLRPEVGGGLFLTDDENGDLFSPGFGAYAAVVANYQLTPMISAGLGVGYMCAWGSYSYSFYRYNNDIDRTSITTKYDPIAAVPVFANARLYLSGGKCQPFFDVKLGFMVGLNSSTVDVTRRYTSIGNPFTTTLSDGSSYYGATDTWNQYDDVAKLSGIYGGLAFGLSFRNFAVGIEADMVNWVYNQSKSQHVEVRPNGLPDWEYQSGLATHNTVTALGGSGDENKSRTLLSFRLDYNIPVKTVK